MGGARFRIRPSMMQTKRKVKPTCKRKEKGNSSVSRIFIIDHSGVLKSARENTGMHEDVRVMLTSHQKRVVTCRQTEIRLSPLSASEKAFLQCFSESEKSPCPDTSALSDRERERTVL